MYDHISIFLYVSFYSLSPFPIHLLFFSLASIVSQPHARKVRPNLDEWHTNWGKTRGCEEERVFLFGEDGIGW